MKPRAALITAIAAVFTMAGCATAPIDRARLKQEIKQEILAELRAEPLAPSQRLREDERARIREEVEREVIAAIQQREQTRVQENASTPASPESRPKPETGSAKGAFTRDGVPLPECRVKLTRILRSGALSAILNTFKEGVEYETVTDAEGRYRFDAIPVGDYKLKWQLPHDKGWIRRLSNKADATVLKSETTLLKPIETNKRLVPR